MFERLANELAQELFALADTILEEHNSFRRWQFVSDAYEIEKKANQLFEKAGSKNRVSFNFTTNGSNCSVFVTAKHQIPNLRVFKPNTDTL